MGCSTVVREFYTPPGTRSAKTKASDNALQRMATRYGLSDLSASKTGSVAGDRMAKHPQGFGKVGQEDFTPRWGAIPKGGTFDVRTGGPVARDGGEGGAESIVKSLSGGRAEPMPDNSSALPIGLPGRRPPPNVVGRDSITANEFSDAIRKAS